MKSAVMYQWCRQLSVSGRKCLTLAEMGCLSAVRRKHTKARYQADPQAKERKIKSHSAAKESSVSILRDPGVVLVEKLTKEKLCEVLMQSVVYMKGPLVVINKPQGLSVTGKQEEVSVSLLLAELRQCLGVRDDLHVVKAAPKESSGLVLLSSCHVTTKRIEEFYSECRKLLRPIATYCAVTVGVPSPAEGEIEVALKSERIGEQDMVVPVMNPSKGSLERREVKKTHTQYKVLDHTEGCALVQMQPKTTFQNQLLVHTTLKFCTVLGDHTYSARVGKVLGEDIYLPVDVALPRTQLLEEPILRRMHFTQQQMHRMPLHLHLHQLQLPSEHGEGKPVFISAPPPLFFQRTLQLLGLKLEEPTERI
ncbi:mitochondrial mRNA pseudouridine synthase RPUSD3 [Bombina bombina]|uniref:mitochondrial mRNA pseudouridine synthase RPUSD3 n=1 Tax=Bombina bombina TaxID=8345 RepID=UPI00235B0C5E|nr:mitochondrial mRNA pseudouridine synthase RPUSD3 [Bombina bombina]